MLKNTNSKAVAIREDEEGQALVEYGLILALVSVLGAAALLLMGPAVQDILNQVTGFLG